jgi:large subunit ribosomal protein L25
MAERVVIKAAARTVVGKKVATLRRNGRLPGNVYGSGIESRAVDIDAREFSRTIKSAGLRAMIQLDVDGESKPRYVILRGISRKGGTGDPIHIDFFQVDPEKPIQANVPLRLVGEAPAVRDLAGTLLPGFDVSLTVADLTPIDGVEIVTDPSVVVVTVLAPRLKKV